MIKNSIQKSYAHTLVFLGLDPATEFHSDSIRAFNSKNPFPFWNIAMITAPFTSTDLQNLNAYFGPTPYTITISEQDKEGIQLLEEHGFKTILSSLAMTAEHSAIAPYTKNEHISVQEVTDQATIFNTWVPLVTQAYDITDSEKECSQFIQYLQKTEQHKNIKFFIGYWQNTPVATSMLVVYPDSAALQFVGTLPAYRKKGIGKAVSCYTLQTLDAKKIKKICLLASSEGKPLYEKIGFNTKDSYNDMCLISKKTIV
ncbi:MAG: GNAT family N-acetyltransferase [bacterium]